MSKILITGAAGFVGCHLARHILATSDDRLVLVDNLQRGRMDEDMKNLLASGADRVAFLTLDLTDPSSVGEFPRDLDQVYHLAAVNGTKWFYEMPDETLRINTLSLVYVLEWMKTLPRKPKLCFPSSNEAYAGALASFGRLPIPTPEDVPLVISDPYNPRWSYAATKLIGELFVIHYAARHHFDAVIIRPHSFYGPRAGYEHVVPEFCGRIASRTDPFPIYGADETRTFCYITDAVRAMEMFMNASSTNGQPIQTVHIGATEEVTMKQLAERLFAAAGWKPSSLDIHPAPEGCVKRRRANIEKIKRLIPWEPEISLDEGLRRTYEWYEKHPKTDA
jgi:nucleoside-diphosphate-sugar epimerase